MGEAYYLGIEAGGTHLRIAAVDRSLNVRSFKKIRSEELSDAKDKAAYLESLMMPYFHERGRENCRCVCLSLASLMDRDRTVCFNSPNIRGFDDLPLKSIFRSRWRGTRIRNFSTRFRRRIFRAAGSSQGYTSERDWATQSV